MGSIRFFDIFGVKPLLSVDGKNNKSFKTSFGGLMTILFILKMLILFSYFFIYSIFFNRSGSIVSYFKYYLNNKYSSFGFGKDLDFALFGISNDFSIIYLDPELISIEIITIEYNYYTKWNQSEINYTSKFISPSVCNVSQSSNFLKLNESFIKQNKPLCFKNTDYLALGGSILDNGSLRYSKLYVYIKNISHPDYNKTISKLSYIGLISGFYSPQVLEMQNPKMYTEIIHYFQIFTTNLLKIQYVSFVSYENIFPFTSPSLNNTFPIVSLITQQGFSDLLLVLDFSMDFYSMNINRKYDTIDLYIAKYSSILNLLFMIFTKLCNLMSDKEFNIDYINKFIRVKNSNFQTIEMNDIGFSVDKILSDSRNKKLQDLNIKQRNKYEEIKFNTKLEISVYDIICSRKSKKYKEYQYFSSILSSIMSFENIINVITDMKRLKYLLFDEDEEKAFDFYMINGYCENNFSLSPKNKEISYEILENIMNKNEKQNKCFFS